VPELGRPLVAQPEAENAAIRPGNADYEAVCATRYAVINGDVVRLVLSDDCNPRASIVLAPAEIIAMTADLLAVARVRRGR
jgi:hypothetical protein